MKVLIAPMAAMAETAGSFRRVAFLAEYLNRNQIQVALCAAKDQNYHEIKGIRTYELSVPTPLGLPGCIAKHTFPIAQKLGITSRKEVKSFEDVLFLTGNNNARYLAKAVEEVRTAIKDFDPDVVYSEFNLSAILAAKLEHRTLYTTVSMPTQRVYAENPRLAKGTIRYVKERNDQGLPAIQSSLDLFQWADQKFVPSCFELEPFQDKTVTFCGSFETSHRTGTKEKQCQKNLILVYMGNGTISQSRMIREVSAAFRDTKYQVYLAGSGLSSETQGNLHMGPRFPFAELLDQAVLYLHHGGQNSMIDGLRAGVPQLVCPGHVFERNYNADCIVKNHAGLKLAGDEFRADRIRELSDRLIAEKSFTNHALQLGIELEKLNGPENILHALLAHSSRREG